MPGKNGLEVLRQITTQFHTIKVIIITGFGSLEKAVESFRSGACDFIEKPIVPEELYEAIDRVLCENTEHKRKVLLLEQLETTVEQIKDLEGITTTNRYVRREISFAHEIVFDVDRHELRQGNHRVHLTPTESKLLIFFTENSKRVINFFEIVKNVQGYETYDREAACILRPMISRLRIKLKEFPAAENWIENVRGKGYIFLPQ